MTGSRLWKSVCVGRSNAISHWRRPTSCLKKGHVWRRKSLPRTFLCKAGARFAAGSNQRGAVFRNLSGALAKEASGQSAASEATNTKVCSEKGLTISSKKNRAP